MVYDLDCVWLYRTVLVFGCSKAYGAIEAGARGGSGEGPRGSTSSAGESGMIRSW